MGQYASRDIIARYIRNHGKSEEYYKKIYVSLPKLDFGTFLHQNTFGFIQKVKVVLTFLSCQCFYMAEFCGYTLDINFKHSLFFNSEESFNFLHC